jgi:hypothetical protein
MPVEHLADRVGESGYLGDSVRDRRHARLVQPQAVEERLADLGFAASLTDVSTCASVRAARFAARQMSETREVAVAIA